MTPFVFSWVHLIKSHDIVKPKKNKLKKYSNPPAERSGPGQMPVVIAYPWSSLLLARERDSPFFVDGQPTKKQEPYIRDVRIT